MFLKHLHLLNFKNWEQAEFNFSENINCLVGNNGSGKTNVLDAIHYLSVCKSYLNPVDSQNIKDETSFMVVEGEFHKNDSNHHIYCGLKKGQKKIFKKNKKEYDRLADHVGQFPSVVISPYDRDLITEGSDVRRKFMDAVISQSDPVYLDNVIRYNKALQQRNALLKYFAANHSFDRENLAIYDQQLIEKGYPIFEKRKEFTEILKPRLLYYYGFISGSKEQPDMMYNSQLHERNLEELLKTNLDKDRVNQYTGVGVHKDDLEFRIEGRSVKKFGSQGQQKSFLIALKLAQYEFLKEKQGIKPLLLLDDIFDKLDEERVKQLVTLVDEEEFGQIFITDTHPERTFELVKSISEKARVFTIEKGKVLNEEEQ